MNKNSSKITLGCSRLRISLPVFVAIKNKIFEKYNLNVDVKFYDTAQPLMNDLLRGGIDIGGYTALPITYDGIVSKKHRLYYLTTLIEDDEHRISYFLKAQTAKINDLQELKGKRIGVLPTYAYRAWLNVILNQNGINPYQDVEIVEVKQQKQENALLSGEIEALFTNDPVATSVLQSGAGSLITKENEVLRSVQNPLVFGSFNASKKWADSNPDIFGALADALDEAVDFVNQNQDTAKLIMKEFIPKKFQEHVENYPSAKYLKTKDSPLHVFQDMEDAYLKMGILEMASRDIWFGCDWKKGQRTGKKYDVQNLSFAYKNNLNIVPIFEDVSFDVEPGEILGIMGGNGCGKTTLLRTMAGLEKATSGKVNFPSMNKNSSRLSYLPQTYRESFFDWASLKQNIDMLVKNGGQIAEDINKEMGLNLNLDLMPSQCSGGMLQQAGIIRAFAKKPSVLFADEPFSALDVKVSAKIRMAFSRFIRRHNIVSVLVLHDLSDVIDVCDRVMVLQGSPFSTEKITSTTQAVFVENRRLNNILEKETDFSFVDLLTQVLKK